MAQNFRRYTLNNVGVVAQDIPDGSIVVGVPGKIVDSVYSKIKEKK